MEILTIFWSTQPFRPSLPPSDQECCVPGYTRHQADCRFDVTVGSSVQSVTASPARNSFEKARAPASPASPSERFEANDKDTTIESEPSAKRYCNGAWAAKTAQRLAPSAPSKYAQAKGSAVLAALRKPTGGNSTACRQAFSAQACPHVVELVRVRRVGSGCPILWLTLQVGPQLLRNAH